MVGRLARAGFRVGVVSAGATLRPQAFDYSGARFDPAALVAAGLRGVVRYQWIEAGQRPDFNRSKAITKPEYDGLRGAGLAVALVCQVDKDNYLRGYPEGLRHGGLSLQHSRSMGHPDSCDVFLAVQDQSIPPSNYNLAVEYMHGFKDGRGLGRPQLMYGGTNVGNLCVNAGYARGIWQAAASSWSTAASPWVVLRQLTSKSFPQFPPLTYDENDIVGDWGQNPGPAVIAPTPAGVAQATWGT